MLRNRSVPVDTVLPHVAYQDVAGAIEWLRRAFGFAEHYRYGDPVSGAQMRAGGAWIMVVSARGEFATPARLGFRTQSITVFIDGVDAHYERAKAAGVKIVEDLHETVYGERQYGAKDLDGHLWLFSQHAQDLSPADWGATIAADFPH